MRTARTKRSATTGSTKGAAKTQATKRPAPKRAGTAAKAKPSSKFESTAAARAATFASAGAHQMLAARQRAAAVHATSDASGSAPRLSVAQFKAAIEQQLAPLCLSWKVRSGHEGHWEPLGDRAAELASRYLAGTPFAPAVRANKVESLEKVPELLGRIAAQLPDLNPAVRTMARKFEGPSVSPYLPWENESVTRHLIGNELENAIARVIDGWPTR